MTRWQGKAAASRWCRRSSAGDLVPAIRAGLTRVVLALPIPVLPMLFLAGCSAAPGMSLAEAQHPGSLTQQADCRTQAADSYIRPYYRYGDLMTRAQQERRVLAVEADRHQISRATYNRDIAQSEKAISHAEDQRNQAAHTASSYVDAPDTSIGATLSRLFR
jgi:hypothetical protein